jgi:ABC-2 type transport system permease protein
VIRSVLLLLGKDLRVLRRSPALLAPLLAYPVVIAVLLGLVAGYANSKPRVALVDEDGLPHTAVIGGHRFDIDRTIAEASKNVKLLRLGPEDAERQLETGKIVASLTVPPGFMSDLRGMVRSPKLLLRTTEGGVAPRVTQQVQALVYTLNQRLQEAYIDSNLRYVELLQRGGEGRFLTFEFRSLGLQRAERLLAEAPRDAGVGRVLEFVRVARRALDETGAALRATANPITLEQASERGRTSVLSAQVQAYALALTITFLALTLAAAALAAERDENVVARLSRGLVRLGELVGAKVALAALMAIGLGGAVALAFGVVVELRGVEGGEPWQRLPLLLAGILVAGAALGALGAVLGGLARETRTASLVALLVVLPVVFLGLVPREVAPAAGWLSDALPFAHAVRLFGSALYDASPWATVFREAAWLLGLGAVFAVLARLGARRLLT